MQAATQYERKRGLCGSCSFATPASGTTKVSLENTPQCHPHPACKALDGSPSPTSGSLLMRLAGFRPVPDGQKRHGAIGFSPTDLAEPSSLTRVGEVPEHAFVSPECAGPLLVGGDNGKNLCKYRRWPTRKQGDNSGACPRRREHQPAQVFAGLRIYPGPVRSRETHLS